MNYLAELCVHLSELDGVIVLWVAENNTFDYDYERCLPPMSFRVTLNGGKKKEIANTIWRYKPLGVRSVGNTSKKVKDCCGFKHEVYWENWE